MKSCWGNFAIALLVILTATAKAQEPAPSQISEIQKRLELLEQKLDQLEKRVNAVMPQTGEATSSTGTPADRLAAIDEKLRLLERNDKEQAQVFIKAKDSPTVSAGRDGFSITSADKAYRLKIGGYAQADGKTFYDDTAHLLTNSFSVRRARLNFDGTVGRYIELRLAPELGNGSVVLYDAYADFKYVPYAVLRGGKFKSPIGLEMLQNDTELTFIERSLASALIPNRDVGFQLSGDFAGRMTYAVAALNGAPDGTNIDGDGNDGKDIVGRVFLTPFASGGAKNLNGLGIGIAASTGRQNGAVLPSFKSTGGQATFFSYLGTAIAAGRRLRYSPQLYYYNGAVSLMAEYVESSQEIKGATLHNISNHAWQVSGSWVLTGEKKSYKGVQAVKPIEGGKNPGFGAWELAGRYSELNVDSMAFTANFADITKSARAARNWAIGLNWYLNRNARLSMDYEQTRFLGGAVGGNRPTEKAFEQRFQVVF